MSPLAMRNPSKRQRAQTMIVKGFPIGGINWKRENSQAKRDDFTLTLLPHGLIRRKKILEDYHMVEFKSSELLQKTVSLLSSNFSLGISLSNMGVISITTSSC